MDPYFLVAVRYLLISVEGGNRRLIKNLRDTYGSSEQTFCSEMSSAAFGSTARHSRSGEIASPAKGFDSLLIPCGKTYASLFLVQSGLTVYVSCNYGVRGKFGASMPHDISFTLFRESRRDLSQCFIKLLLWSHSETGNIGRRAPDNRCCDLPNEKRVQGVVHLPKEESNLNINQRFVEEREQYKMSTVWTMPEIEMGSAHDLVDDKGTGSVLALDVQTEMYSDASREISRVLETASAKLSHFIMETCRIDRLDLVRRIGSDSTRALVKKEVIGMKGRPARGPDILWRITIKANTRI
ncbi:hypothetical protein ARMGADRAFT_1039238 [Armillaria gallica]|uniref:Uncharacterized protein n=1 Tax=Armillaria gallica TaxID=47427 RepID=A0A2H3CJN2_ARMGA|nr:hypothetical protein ARMGADRAFT_1039238 [Armillaria gallica]